VLTYHKAKVPFDHIS